MREPALPCGQQQRGFTLIELLMVVVIFAIGASIAAPNFASQIANYRVRSASEAMLNGLYLARAEAIRRNSPVSFTLGAPGSGWTVAQVAPAATIQTRGDGESPGVSAGSSSASLTVSFLANGLVDTAPAARLEQVNVSSASAGSERRRINIFGGGLIRMCDPAVSSANDPRRC
jgi:type IV fimbrial biogenesis protein FimT